MKKSVVAVALALAFIFAFAGMAFAAGDCATIQSGTITDVKNRPVSLGYDEWGYNYEAHMFNGLYGNYSRPDTPVDTGDELIMKWNDAWLSNKDCQTQVGGNPPTSDVPDGKLDRHFGFDTYKGSGAWLTNHQSGKYEWPEGSGKLKKWTYFVKIVAVPSDATMNGAYWQTVEGITIGPAIWGPFAIIEEVSHDPAFGLRGKQYKSPAGPGFGIYGKEGD